MKACNMVPARLLLVGAFALACTRDDRSLPVAPSFSLSADPVLSGALLGPDGTNICNTIGSGTMLVRLLNPNFPTGPAFLGAQNPMCPTNSYSFSADASTARVRVQLPTDAIVGLALPWRSLDEVAVGDADVTHDVHIVDGTALGGSATLDGSPIEGVGLDVVYAFNPNFGATSGVSAPDGHWAEFFGRPQLILQHGVSVRTPSGCAALAVKVLEAPPTDPFVFPTDRSAINCTLVTAPTTQFSHTLTRLVVTPLPGDIGGFSPELLDQYGDGWGVQFPVAAGTSPAHFPFEASHIFLGGLLIGISPDRVLSGTNVAGEMECGAACRDLGLDATLGFTDQTPTGRKVSWQYSDAPSPEGVGLRIRQRSFDGAPPNDYVLFDFSIQNQGSSTVTFYPGFWADWDVDLDAADDVGFTEMNGKLMYETSTDPDDAGTYVGTLLGGDAAVSGNYFFSGAQFQPSTTDQVQALSGGLRQETLGPGDLRYIHGIGPITLARGKRADLWVAIVAGENHTQLLANAAAADGDIGKRQRQAGSAVDGSITVNAQPLGVPGRPFSKSRKLQ